jgi:hypothetical protein
MHTGIPENDRKKTLCERGREKRKGKKSDILYKTL